MHKTLHLIDDINKLFVSSKEGGKGLASIEDCMDGSIQKHEDIIKKRKERLITMTKNCTEDININRTTKTWKQKWYEKKLCRYIKRQTEEISREKNWTWLKKGKFREGIESLWVKAQNHIFETTYKANKIRSNRITNVGYIVIGNKWFIMYLNAAN